ncbi:VCBS repeat-containing protein [Streptomyces sp. PmtG]
MNKGTDAKGGGGWEELGQVAAGVAPAEKVRFADINGDGKADYLVLEDNGAVKAWLNKGTDAKGGGGWEELGQVAAGVAPAGKVRFADINGDGKADYLVLGDNGAVKAWLNKGTDAKGGGGWEELGQVAAGVAPAEKVRFADINGDGKADYLVLEDNGAVKAWLNKGTDAKGGGGWEELGQVAAGVAPAGKVRFADINGDGKADYLVLDDNGAIDAWINNGGDTASRGWTERGQVATGVGLPSKYVWLGDFDGDKKVDYLAAKGGRAYDECMLFNRGGDGRGGWTERTGTDCDRGSDGPPPYTPYFKDFDGDGKADHLEVMPDGGLMYWKGTGKGNFVLDGGATVATGIAPGEKVRLADFDGDSKADYLVLENDGAVSVWLNKGGDVRGGWESIGRVAAGVAPAEKVRFADIDGDGKTDYLVVEDDGSVKAWLNNGGDERGGWTELGQIAAGVAPRDNVRFADFDGDGKDDYLVLEDDGAMKAWLNNGGDAQGWIEVGRIAAGMAPASRVRI